MNQKINPTHNPGFTKHRQQDKTLLEYKRKLINQNSQGVGIFIDELREELRKRKS